jgi:cytochrome P450
MPTEKGNSLLFGVSPQLMKDDFNLFNFYRDLTKKHGKVFRLKVSPRKYIVVVANAEYADFVRRQEGKYPERGDQLRALEYIQEEIDSATKALGNSDGPEWHKARSELNPVVNPRKLGRHVNRLDPVSQTFLEIVQESVDKDGYSRDLMEFLPYWSVEAMSRFLYPEPLDVQRSRDYRAIDTMVGLQEAVNTIRVAHYPVWMLKYLPLKIMKEGREGFRKFKMASLSIMKEMEEKKSSTSEDPAEGTFYEQFRARGMPDNTILAIMADFLAAGTDTTINTTAYTLHQLAKYPEVQKKAHDEVVSVAGKDGVITDEVMQKLSYIKAVQKEASRCAPFSAGAIRVISEDVDIGGYNIPAKTMILLCTPGMSRDSTVFKDPEEFEPERWIREDDSKQRKLQQIGASIFGIGPRSCIGRRVAELEMWSLLAKIMQKAQLELHPDSVGLEPVGAVMMRPDRPLRVKITPV